jgi:hypothetical protein
MKTADRILTKDGKIHVHLNCIVFKDNDLFIGIIPTLKLTAHSSNKEDLQIRLEDAIKKFFNFYKKKGEVVFKKELKRLGWGENNQPPSTVSLPTQVTYSESERGELELCF